MVIDDFNVQCIGSEPFKADSVLIVDPNAVQSLSIALESFQAKAFPVGEVSQRASIIEKDQLAICQVMQRFR
jgi:hypothetical protein